MVTLEVLLAALTVASLLFYVACTIFTRRFFATPNAIVAPNSADNPAISLLVPVRGVDEGAWENWSSLCQQAYPDYEVLFGVMEANDPAVPVLRKLVKAFPKQAQLFVGLPPRGVNFKDSNLSYLLEKANNDVIVFADSDIRVSGDYLRTVAAPLADATIGMVTCCFVGRNPQSIGAALASLGRCCDFIPSLLIARELDNGLRCAVGATIAMRRSVLDRVGGLHLNRIGSDYNLGKRTAQAGYGVELSRYVLESDTGTESVRQVFQRELRWARTIRFNRGAIYYTMLICYGSLFSVPLLVLSGFAPWAIALALLAWLLRLSQAVVAIASVDGLGLLRWLWLLPLRDGMNLGIWAIGSFGQTVNWRGRWLRVRADGLLSPIEEGAANP